MALYNKSNDLNVCSNGCVLQPFNSPAVLLAETVGVLKSAKSFNSSDLALLVANRTSEDYCKATECRMKRNHNTIYLAIMIVPVIGTVIIGIVVCNR